MKKILILGGGFGGLVTAERLAKSIGNENQITLVSPNRIFTFYPALVRLAFGELEEPDVVFDLEKKLHKLDVKFIEGEVLHLKPELHRAQIAGKEFNGDISYDYLVIAMGRRLATEKMYGFFDHAHHLLGVKAAQKFGRAVDEFNGGDIIVALSPDSFLPVPVCETAFSLARRFPDSARISVVFPNSVKEAFGGADIYKELQTSFTKNGIALIENYPISKILPNKIISQNDREIPFNLLMLIPPFRGQSRLFENGITDDLNFVEVDEFMRVKRINDAYAVGDIVSFSGPKLAHIAIGQAQIAAENIKSEIEGNEPEAIYYHEIATIIDQGGADSIYLNYGVWDDNLHRIRHGNIWGLVKRIHDKIWRTRHQGSWFEKAI